MNDVVEAHQELLHRPVQANGMIESIQPKAQHLTAKSPTAKP